MFSLLPQPKSRWKEFISGFGLSGLVVAAVVLIGLLRPHMISEVANDYQDYHLVALVEVSPPVNHQPAPIRVIEPAQPIAPLKNPIPDNLRLQAPRPPVTADDPVVPKIQIAARKAPVVDDKKVVIPRQLVRTNVFSTGSSAIPTVAANPKNVQTGGFGDPNGVPASDSHGRRVTIAQLGSFDLPSGPGYGNGTGGRRGIPGVVASAGFGNQVATGDASGRVSATRGTVQQSAFGDANQPIAREVPSHTAQQDTSKVTPVEILAKPSPAYTNEARKLRIEGEVLLEVVFEASGKLHVVRVIRGLGHGLDENAARAAEQIRFKPATKEGQPTDSTATLHIIFQLA